MKLNEFVAQTKNQVFSDLGEGRAPSLGEHDSDLLAQCRAKGSPRMGTTRFEPTAVVHEFIYAEGGAGGTHILPVRIAAPERIVFMPVPGWVIENIWQGDIDGSYHFLSDSTRLVDEYLKSLEEGPNSALFGPRQATRRE